jgi:hypothetical protein
MGGVNDTLFRSLPFSADYLPRQNTLRVNSFFVIVTLNNVSFKTMFRKIPNIISIDVFGSVSDEEND